MKIILILFSLISFLFADVTFNITFEKENISKNSWDKMKKSFEIQFREPIGISPIRLTEINTFNFKFDAYKYSTSISFSIKNEKLSTFKEQLYEVVLVDKLDNYPLSLRKRFNLLTPVKINFEMKRSAFSSEIRILNENTTDVSVIYDGELYDNEKIIIKGNPDTEKIKILKVTADGFAQWQQAIYEGTLLKEKELLLSEILYSFENGFLFSFIL